MEDVLAALYELAFMGVEDGLTVREAWQLAIDSIGPEALMFI